MRGSERENSAGLGSPVLDQAPCNCSERQNGWPSAEREPLTQFCRAEVDLPFEFFLRRSLKLSPSESHIFKIVPQELPQAMGSAATS